MCKKIFLSPMKGSCSEEIPSMMQGWCKGMRVRRKACERSLCKCPRWESTFDHSGNPGRWGFWSWHCLINLGGSYLAGFTHIHIHREATYMKVEVGTG
jgi:hypothetical protein